MSETNAKRGLRRLLMAFVLPWFAVWTVVLVVNGQIVASEARHALDLMRTEFKGSSIMSEEAEWEMRKEEIKATHERWRQAKAWRERAVIFGFATPMALFVLGGAGFWVWRGFRPAPPA